jgi:fructose-1-phosphate kinase PfkB-like protein
MIVYGSIFLFIYLLTFVDTIKLGMACGTANTLFIKTGKVTKQKVNQFRDKIEVVQI